MKPASTASDKTPPQLPAPHRPAGRIQPPDQTRRWV